MSNLLYGPADRGRGSRTHHRVVLAIAAMTLAVLSACGSHRPDGVGGPAPLDTVRDLPNDRPVVDYASLPFVNSLGWGRTDATARQKRAAALANCLMQAGFPRDAVPPDAGGAPLDAPDSTYSSYLTVPTVADAATHGYGIVEAIQSRTLTGDEVPTAHDRWQAGLDEQQATAFGEHLATCENLANRAALATNAGGLDQQMIERMFVVYRNDKVVAGMYRRWSGCMKEAGFAGLDDPGAARSMVLGRYFAPIAGTAVAPMSAIDGRHVRDVHKQEVALSLADIGCQAAEIAPRMNELRVLQSRLLDDAQTRAAGNG
jgi:hypothetical protein